MLPYFLEAHFGNVHADCTSRSQSVGLATRIPKPAALFATARNIESSVVNNTLHPALSAHAMCRASTALNPEARSSFARAKSIASGTTDGSGKLRQGEDAPPSLRILPIGRAE